GKKLYFAATDDAHGLELWMLEANVPPAITLCGSTGEENITATQQFSWDVTDASGLASLLVTVTRDSGSGPQQIFSTTNLSQAHGSFNFDTYGVGTYVLAVSAVDAADADKPGDSLAASA